ncbi:MAG: cytochrome c [Acidobacteria bacterium]|nr:cytochrome c [Acidobacteriota bacterium]
MAMTGGQIPSGGGEAARGRALFYGMMCASCHGLGAQGGLVGPGLAGLGAEAVMDAVEEGPGGMPRFHLTHEEIRAIVAFLKAAED